MVQIAARAGGSKTTLYGYFDTKQELFAAVMIDAMNAQAEALTALIGSASGDPRDALMAFGRGYHDLVLSPEIIRLKRIRIAEGDQAIGAKLYKIGPERGVTMLAEHLQEWIDLGVLRQAPAHVVASHLIALLDAGVVEPTMSRVRPMMSRRQALEQAVDVFLRAYAA